MANDDRAGSHESGALNAAIKDAERLRPPGRVGVLFDRLLTAASTRELQPVLGAVDPTWGGVWVGGDNAALKIAGYRDAGFDELVLVADPEIYCKRCATPEVPFDLPGTLDGGLDAVLDDQLARGASVAATPSLYVAAGDSASLKAQVRRVSELERDDTVFVVAAAVAWLNKTFIDQFSALLQAAKTPIGLRLGGQFDPLAKVKEAPENLRRLEREVPHLMRLGTDLSAIDGLCHNSFAGAIGLTSTRRHLIPPGEIPKSAPSDGPPPPSVLVSELLSFIRTTSLAEKFANSSSPSCSCSICHGQKLTRLLHPTEDKLEARSHNIAVWSALMHTLQRELPRRADRGEWWKKRCQVAVDHHTLFNDQLRNPKAFKSQAVLTRWAKLPA
ncbi:hypothetical protein AMES_7210 [Amycolatopsis mediterranei S699]|uniref:tRNA-guanine(15) transglycosylase-like domain-containing protein n=2 Tax=Amycolatopsis mediterranei TaxID=33910 RepID=A0A0H3DFQ6_AMYMU|nr:hypothetical protein [Amycolatopsis mediterranei]ADJ49037.1 hypothetical protein AMED_7322 [Amycolatopsis mediterranei U32]AEK45993.1 hypothetical protein RAM_37630 [Amycolatopsis mediterranei S699]AFO80743.1 hypothetical protein AMES_7210 [Amycolatopsis mediterranei S699]AGT87871.1 hypothetical protein B737_7210 [Amycolatopsis mediterranei RB]KDU93841.1 hypothetical protein DV36_00435 [Amycolatopsis mediterranei]